MLQNGEHCSEREGREGSEKSERCPMRIKEAGRIEGEEGLIKIRSRWWIQAELDGIKEAGIVN